MAYNVFLHPLRGFPGPAAQRASALPWAARHALGLQAMHTQRLHDRYGPVVRLGPRHLSFTDPAAWRDIYGHRIGDNNNGVGVGGPDAAATGGRPEMAKSAGFVSSIRALPHSIINAPRDEHARLRRALSHGFSDASMRQQEPLIARYVDVLVRKLRQACAEEEDDDDDEKDGDEEDKDKHGDRNDDGDGKRKRKRRAHNMEAWYNYTTFDVVGDLVFGHSFGCLERSDYHPWIAFIFQSVRTGAALVALCYVGGGFLVQWIWALGANMSLAKMRGLVGGMLTARLEMDKPRVDLFEGLVRRRKEWVSFLILCIFFTGRGEREN